MTEKLDTAKRRITALLDRAEHPNTSEHEAAACRDKAEDLMREYRIERAMLNLKGHDKRRFEVKDYTVKGQHMSAFVFAFEHANCKVAYAWQKMTAIGYPEDIFYAETLYTRAVAEIEEALRPLWDNNLTDAQNIYRLRRSGMGWDQVFSRLPEHVIDNRKITNDRNGYSKVRYLFTTEEKRRGDQPFIWRRDKSTFEKSFVDGFDSRFGTRLYELREHAKNENPSEGEQALALLTDDEALREEFYNLFPQYRPATPEQRAASRARREAERQAEEERRANLTDAQRRKEDEAKERAERKRDREWQKYVRANRPDEKAWAVGTESADKIRLRLDDEVQNNSKYLNV